MGGAPPFVEAAFLGYAEGGGVIGVDEANSTWIGKMRVAPGEDGADCFGGVAFAVHGGRENPSGFAKIFDGRNEFAMEIGEADFTGESGGGFFFEDPEAETEKRPVSGVAEEFSPGFFLGERAATDESGHDRIGPHGAAGWEILEAMVAETKARRFDDGKFLGARQRLDHQKILTQGAVNIGMGSRKADLEDELAKR
jgi:hypothetical protein